MKVQRLNQLDDAHRDYIDTSPKTIGHLVFLTMSRCSRDEGRCVS